MIGRLRRAQDRLRRPRRNLRAPAARSSAGSPISGTGASRREAALLDELHRRDRGDRLGHRGDAEHGVRASSPGRAPRSRTPERAFIEWSRRRSRPSRRPPAPRPPRPRGAAPRRSALHFARSASIQPFLTSPLSLQGRSRREPGRAVQATSNADKLRPRPSPGDASRVYRLKGRPLEPRGAHVAALLGDAELLVADPREAGDALADLLLCRQPEAQAQARFRGLAVDRPFRSRVERDPGLERRRAPACAHRPGRAASSTERCRPSAATARPRCRTRARPPRPSCRACP